MHNVCNMEYMHLLNVFVTELLFIIYKNSRIDPVLNSEKSKYRSSVPFWFSGENFRYLQYVIIRKWYF